MTTQLRQQAHAALAHVLQRDPLFSPHADLAWTIEEEIGRGAMGAVHRVRDRSLGRVAALKVLHSEEHRRVVRFLREARVTARLEHPGIPPVYEAGRNTEGRHYLLMRLIEGQTLAVRISDLHGSGKPEPAALRELLHVLVRVAEAVGYAHSQGIVHRDLKPDNVMVGAYGEVLVMDWGLAKVHGQADPGSSYASGDPSASSGSSADSDSRLTVDGAVLGTPGFIAPELLQGKSVDARADVFALGAILAAILTGESPFPGNTTHEVLARNAQGAAVLPKERDPSLPGALNAITQRALAASPQARYPSAKAFTSELRAFLAGDRVASYSYSLGERARGVMGRHAVLLVVLGLVGALGLGAALATARATSAGAARARQAISQEAQEASVQAWGAYEVRPQAVPAEQIALAMTALDAAQRWHGTSDGDPAAEAARGRAALALAQAALAAGQLGLASAACVEAEGLGAAGAPDLRQQIDTALQRRDEELDTLIGEAERGDLGGVGERLEDSVLALMRYPDAVTVVKLVRVLNQISAELEVAQREAWRDATEPTQAETDVGEGALEGLLEAYDAYRVGRATPQQLQLRQRGFERLLRRTGRAHVSPERQLELVLGLAASAQQRALTAPGWEDLASVCCQGLGQIGIREQAVPALIRYVLADADPSHAAVGARALCLLGGPEAYDGVNFGMERFGQQQSFAEAVGPWLVFLGDALEQLETSTPQQLIQRAALRERGGDLEGALADADRALKLAPDQPEAWATRGNVQRRRGDLEASLRDYQRALELRPANPAYWNGSAMARERLGDLEGAEADYSRALELAPGLAEVWSNRGALRRTRGDLEGALADLNRAAELDPELGPVYVNRGLLHYSLKDLRAALEDLNRAVDLLPESARAYSNRALVRLQLAEQTGQDPAELDRAWEDATTARELDRDLASTWITLGRIRQLRGDQEGALRELSEGRALDDTDFRAMHFRGEAYLKLGRPREALSELEAAVARAPDSPSARYLRASTYAALGDVARAAADAEAFARLAPTSAKAWAMAGEYRLRTGRLGPALLALDKAIELDASHASAYVNRAIARHQGGDPDGALADLEIALRLDPRQTAGWIRRGRILQGRGEARQAEAAYRRALEIAPQTAEASLLLAILLQEEGRIEAAIRTYDELENYDTRSAIPLQRGSCWLGLGRLEAARRDFEAAARHAAPQPYARLMWFGAGGPAKVLKPLLKGQGWVSAIARCLAGELSPQALLEATDEQQAGDPPPATKRCEALCYLGLLAELRGDTAEARRQYTASVASGAGRNVVEFLVAEARLRALGD